MYYIIKLMAELTRGQKRSEYQKMYREAHREQINERDKLYWLMNIEAINEKRLNKFRGDPK